MRVRGVAFGFLVAALAGCVGSTAEDFAVPEGAGDGDGAVVSGLVISEELFPVPDALVTLGELPPAYTDTGGRFEFFDVPVGGTYALAVNATGYEPYSQDLEVVGSLTDLQIPLKGLPGESPYATTTLFTGWDACGISLVYSAGTFPSGSSCPFGQPKKVLKVEVGPHWRAGVHELSWKTSESMIFASSVSTDERPQPASCTTSGSSHTWCPALIWGKTPLRIFARPNDTEYAAKYAIDQKETWPGGENYTSYIFASYSGYGQQEINRTFYNQCVIINRQFNVPENWGCPFGVGYSTGFRIEFFHTTFYLAAPLRLEEFTAMPDG